MDNIELDLMFVGEVDEARAPVRKSRTKTINRARKARGQKPASRKRTADTPAEKRKTTRRKSTANTKSAAHKKAISAGLKKYWASKRSAHRKKAHGAKRTTKKPNRREADRKQAKRVASPARKPRKTTGAKRPHDAAYKKYKARRTNLSTKTYKQWLESTHKKGKVTTPNGKRVSRSAIAKGVRKNVGKKVTPLKVGTGRRKAKPRTDKSMDSFLNKASKAPVRKRKEAPFRIWD